MNRNRPLTALLCFFFFLAYGYQLFAADETKPRDPDNTWTFGITEFRIQTDSQLPEQLSWRFPQLLAKELRDCPLHHYRQAERSARQQALKNRQLRELSADITNVRAQLDELFFSEERRTEERDLRRNLQSLMEERETLRGKSSEIFVVPTEKPCVYAEGEGPEGLFRQPAVPAWLMMSEKGLDFLITGTIEEVEELLFVEIYGWSRDARKRELLYRGNWMADSTGETIEEAAVKLRTAVYGRQWADLTVHPDPPSAGVKLYTDTGSRGGDGREFRYLPPGEIRLEVYASGYRSRERSYQLLPGESRRVEITLEPIHSADLRVRSYPQGAELYVGARRIGRTPLTVPQADLPAYFTLRRSGYHERNALVAQDPGGKVLTYRLHPERIDMEQIVRNARDRFYLGLAGFFLSVPLTMYTYGMSTDYAYAYNAAPSAATDERQRLHDLSQLWYTAYLGSLFLNGTFLADTVVQMWNYIDAAQAQ